MLWLIFFPAHFVFPGVTNHSLLPRPLFNFSFYVNFNSSLNLPPSCINLPTYLSIFVIISILFSPGVFWSPLMWISCALGLLYGWLCEMFLNHHSEILFSLLISWILQFLELVIIFHGFPPLLWWSTSFSNSLTENKWEAKLFETFLN